MSPANTAERENWMRPLHNVNCVSERYSLILLQVSLIPGISLLLIPVYL
jgi:hypothetical protein